MLYRFSKEVAGSETATSRPELNVAGVFFDYDGKPSVNQDRTAVTYNFVPRDPASQTKLPGRDQYVPLLQARDHEKLPAIVDTLAHEGYTLRITDLRGKALS